MCILDKRHNYLREGGCVGAHFSTAGLQGLELTPTPAIRWRQREAFELKALAMAYKQTSPRLEKPINKGLVQKAPIASKLNLTIV